jgi:hypothetical protein
MENKRVGKFPEFSGGFSTPGILKHKVPGKTRWNNTGIFEYAICIGRKGRIQKQTTFKDSNH